jgi:hypothetical protein
MKLWIEIVVGITIIYFMIGLLIISFYKYIDIRLYFILGGLILGGMLIIHGLLVKVKLTKQTFPPAKSDHITEIHILNPTRQRLKSASHKDQNYDDKINELLDLENNAKNRK